MVIFKESSNSLIKNFIGQNKNGKGSYEFTEANYKAGLCGQGHNLNASFTRGNPTYDAARKNMGEPWMIPYRNQYQELINTNNTTSEWTSINGTNGRKFISKTDSSKYIFLPAGGGFNGSYSYHTWTVGYYLSNSVNIWDRTCGMFLSVNSNIVDVYGDRSRYNGLSIRGIQ